MSENRRQLEAMLFKQVPGGFIYRAPNPWIFGCAKHYLVNEAQKAELLRIVVAPRPMLRLAAIVALVLLWVVAMTTIVWAFSGHADPTAGDAVIMSISTFSAMFLAMHFALRRKLEQVQPILAHAKRTPATITAREMRIAVNKTTSLKGAVIFGAVWAFACATQVSNLVISNPRHPLFSDIQSDISLLIVTVSAVMVIRHFRLVIRKMRQKQAVP
jgi:hypothetical protein